MFIVLSIVVLGIIAYLKSWMDVWILLVIGGVAGYFLNPWIHAVMIILMVIYYYKKRSGNDGDTIRFFITAALIAGLLIGNLLYYLPMIQLDLSLNIHSSPNWFIR